MDVLNLKQSLLILWHLQISNAKSTILGLSLYQFGIKMGYYCFMLEDASFQIEVAFVRTGFKVKYEKLE